MNIVILYFLLPALIVVLARLVFGYLFPMSIGFYFSDNANRVSFHADVSTVSTFCYLNNTLFTFCFVLFSALFILPTVSYLYAYEFIMAYFNVTLILAVIFYMIWFLSLVAAGYIYGRGFFDTIQDTDVRGKFYYDNLYEGFYILIQSPGQLINTLSLFFDNEQKIMMRIKFHKKMAKEYDKAGKPKHSEYLKQAVKRNFEIIEKIKHIRSTRGSFGVFIYNVKSRWEHVVFFPIVPIASFYLVLIGLFANLSPSLKKANDLIME